MARKRNQEAAKIAEDVSYFERDGATIAYSRPTAQGVIEHPALKRRRVTGSEERTQEEPAVTKAYDSFEEVFEEQSAAEQRDHGAERAETSTPSRLEQPSRSTQAKASFPPATREFLLSSEDSDSDSENDTDGSEEGYQPLPSSNLAGLAGLRQRRFSFVDPLSLSLSPDATGDEVLSALRQRDAARAESQPTFVGREDLDFSDSDVEDDLEEQDVQRNEPQGEQYEDTDPREDDEVLEEDSEAISRAAYHALGDYEPWELANAWGLPDAAILEQCGDCFADIVEAVANGAGSDRVAAILTQYGLPTEYATSALARMKGNATILYDRTGLFRDQYLRNVFVEIKLRRSNEILARFQKDEDEDKAKIAALEAELRESRKSRLRKQTTRGPRKEAPTPESDFESDESGDEIEDSDEDSDDEIDEDVASSDGSDEDFEPNVSSRPRRQVLQRKVNHDDSDSGQDLVPDHYNVELIRDHNPISTEEKESVPSKGSRNARQRRRPAMKSLKEKSNALSAFTQANGIDTHKIREDYARRRTFRAPEDLDGVDSNEHKKDSDEDERNQPTRTNKRKRRVVLDDSDNEDAHVPAPKKRNTGNAITPDTKPGNGATSGLVSSRDVPQVNLLDDFRRSFLIVGGTRIGGSVRMEPETLQKDSDEGRHVFQQLATKEAGAPLMERRKARQLSKSSATKDVEAASSAIPKEQTKQTKSKIVTKSAKRKSSKQKSLNQDDVINEVKAQPFKIISGDGIFWTVQGGHRKDESIRQGKEVLDRKDVRSMYPEAHKRYQKYLRTQLR